MDKNDYFAATYPDATPAFRLGYFTPRDLMGFPPSLDQKNMTDVDDYKAGKTAAREDRPHWQSSPSPRA